MKQNLSSWVGLVTPVWELAPKARLWEVLDANLRDQRLAWVMKPDGSYELLQPAGGGGPETMGTR
jgi:polyphosphate kinase